MSFLQHCSRSHPDSSCLSLIFPLLSPSLSFFCHTVTLILRHTPLLSHAAILHNSNSAFIPTSLQPLISLSFSLSHFRSPPCTLSFLSHRPLVPSPFRHVWHLEPSIFSTLPLSVFLFYPPRPSAFILFHLPVQIAIFSPPACLSVCLQS